MAPKREPPTAGDAIVAALSPVLIMGLVGCLVFFLAEFFYAGQYESRLLYTLFFFVVGSVLFGRVAVTLDRARAWMYGGILAAGTFIPLKGWGDFRQGRPMTPLK